MKILSHRGLWKTSDEKNTHKAFINSFLKNFGTETDLRDLNGDLVISHDPATKNALTFNQFLTIIGEYKLQQPIALNIKADGLQHLLKKEWHRLPKDSFLFDMSIPDLIQSLAIALPCFTRLSEYEKEAVLLEKCVGVWVDSFLSEDWYSNSLISELLKQDKYVCIVSPELHKRSHLSLWNRMRSFSCEDKFMLCTDYPEIAKDFFY